MSCVYVCVCVCVCVGEGGLLCCFCDLFFFNVVISVGSHYLFRFAVRVLYVLLCCFVVVFFVVCGCFLFVY